MKEEELALVVGYIMFYDLLDINGSFFSKIDEAIRIGGLFIEKYPSDYKWIEEDFEETLNEFTNTFNK